MSVRISPLISFITAPEVLGSMEATTIVTRGSGDLLIHDWRCRQLLASRLSLLRWFDATAIAYYFHRMKRQTKYFGARVSATDAGIALRLKSMRCKKIIQKISLASD